MPPVTWLAGWSALVQALGISAPVPAHARSIGTFQSLLKQFNPFLFWHLAGSFYTSKASGSRERKLWVIKRFTRRLRKGCRTNSSHMPWLLERSARSLVGLESIRSTGPGIRT
jgi:hypothetical protein